MGGSRGGDGGESRPPTEDATRAHDGPHGQASSNLRPHVGVDDSQRTGSPLEGLYYKLLIILCIVVSTCSVNFVLFS